MGKSIQQEVGEAKIRAVPVPTMALGGLCEGWEESIQRTRSLGSRAHIPKEITSALDGHLDGWT